VSEDIIETLRRFARGAQEQNAADAVSGLLAAADEIERLRAELVSKADELAATIRELRKVEAERDEARRWLCQVLGKVKFLTGLAKPGKGRPEDFATEQGWDCFREDKP
jgi:hypothetical protein